MTTVRGDDASRSNAANDSLLSMDSLALGGGAASSPAAASPRNHPPTAAAAMSNGSLLFDASSLEASTDIVKALFGTAVGPCYGDFFCTHHRIRGRLYATGLAVLYSSNLLGFERRICLRFCEIVELELYRTTSIRITMFDSETYIFRSFNDRVQVLHLLKGLKVVSDRRTSGSGLASSNIPASVEGLRRRMHSGDAMASEPQPPRRDNNAAARSVPFSLQRPQSEGHRLSEAPRPLSEPLISNRRRAVSDSLLRSARGDEDLDSSPLHASFDNGGAFRAEGDVVDDEEESVQTSQEDSTETAWLKAKESIASIPGTAGIESLVIPVSLERFYQLFLADGSPYGLDWFQQRHAGDREIELTGWDLDRNGDNNNSSSSSANSNSGSSGEVVLTRCMTFTHPIKSALGVGPSEARTSRQQRLRRFGDSGIVLENTTVIVDNIPSADAFYVQDYWIVEATSGFSATAKDQVTLSTRFGTRFTKRALFRGIIEKNVLKETTTWFQGYAEMVQSKALAQELPPAAADVAAAAAVPEPLKLQVPDRNLVSIIDLLRKISVSMDRALVLGAGSLFLLLLLLLVQLLLMRQTIFLLQQDLNAVRSSLDTVLLDLRSNKVEVCQSSLTEQG